MVRKPPLLLQSQSLGAALLHVPWLLEHTYPTDTDPGAINRAAGTIAVASVSLTHEVTIGSLDTVELAPPSAELGSSAWMKIEPPCRKPVPVTLTIWSSEFAVSEVGTMICTLAEEAAQPLPASIPLSVADAAFASKLSAIDASAREPSFALRVPPSGMLPLSM